MASILPDTIRKKETVTVSVNNNIRDGIPCQLSEVKTVSDETGSRKTVIVVDSDDLREAFREIWRHSGDDRSKYNKFCIEFLDNLKKDLDELKEKQEANYIYFHNAVIGNDKQYQQHKKNMIEADTQLIDIDEKVFSHLLRFFSIQCKDTDFLIRIVLQSRETFDTLAFDNVIFYNAVEFWHVIFTKEADFLNTSFKEVANFSNTTFKEVADFSTTTFDGVVVFSGAKFLKKAKFSYTKFPQKVGFSYCKSKGELDFYGCDFGDIVDFSGLECDWVPNFKLCHFAKEVSINDIIIPPSPPKEQIEAYKLPNNEICDYYRRLKVMAQEAGDRDLQLQAFAGEMEMKLKNESIWNIKLLPLWLYKLISDYGQSLLRPVVGLFIVWWIFGGIYFCILSGEVSISEVQSLSFFYLSPFNVKESAEFLKEYTDMMSDNNVRFYRWLIFERIIATILWFLVGLALRNRFLIK